MENDLLVKMKMKIRKIIIIIIMEEINEVEVNDDHDRIVEIIILDQ
jgi:hypothetical protein